MFGNYVVVLCLFFNVTLSHYHLFISITTSLDVPILGMTNSHWRMSITKWAKVVSCFALLFDMSSWTSHVQNCELYVTRVDLVCLSFVEGYRKFVDFPTGNSWTNLKSPGKCVTGVGFRWTNLKSPGKCVTGVGFRWTNLKSPGQCVTGVGFRWRIVCDMTAWLGSSVVSERPWVRAPVEPQFFTCYRYIQTKRSLMYV